MSSSLLTLGLIQVDSLQQEDLNGSNTFSKLPEPKALAAAKKRVEQNVAKGLTMTEQAAKQGAQLIILPELFTTGYDTKALGRLYPQLSEALTGPSISAFAEQAKKLGVYIQVGFAEDRGVAGVVYNSVAFINPQGSILGSYAKSHLYGGERLYFAKGNRLVTFATEFGLICPAICYDIGFPEFGRIAALRGAVLLTVSAAWCKADADIWQNNLIARSTDNLFFAAGCNTVGSSPSFHFIGNSRIYGPRGHLIAEAPWDESAVLVKTIDLSEVRQARKNCLYFLDLRPELYGELVRG